MNAINAPTNELRRRRRPSAAVQLARMLEAVTDSNLELGREIQAVRALVYSQRREIEALKARLDAQEARQR